MDIWLLLISWAIELRSTSWKVPQITQKSQSASQKHEDIYRWDTDSMIRSESSLAIAGKMGVIDLFPSRNQQQTKPRP